MKRLGLSLFFLLVVALAAPRFVHGLEPKNFDGSEPCSFQKRDVVFERDGKKIVGTLYLPDVERPVPAVIVCCGFGGNYSAYEWSYCPVMARHGIAVCAFDFCGGGLKSKSDGKTTEMSVLTEADDLEAVLSALAKTKEIDGDNIFLLGESQGGFVASYVAAKRPDDVRGLVAVYPAYVIQDDARKRVPDLAKAPEVMNVMGLPLGKIYHEDATSFDIYELLPNYKRNVLILHGTKDSLVPIEYSERAVKTFPNAELVRIEGAGHGFAGDDGLKALQLEIDFIKKNVVKNNS